MSCPRRTLWLSAATLIAAAGLVHGYIDSIKITPAEPAPGEEITLEVAGGFPDSCWRYRGADFEFAGSDIVVTVRSETFGEVCLPVITPYGFIQTLGGLSIGHYRLTVLDPQDKKSIEFDVEGAPVNMDFYPGDANGEGQVNIADAVFILSYLFGGGPAPGCERAANVNGDAEINIADVITILSYLFGGGPSLPSADCGRAIDCTGQGWLVFCRGHWACDCGACKAVCEDVRCGDGRCDREGGETPDSCPIDCTGDGCKPVCSEVGTAGEGWYDGCTGKRIKAETCSGCAAACDACGTRSEGWYSSCGGLIAYADCTCAKIAENAAAAQPLNVLPPH